MQIVLGTPLVSQEDADRHAAILKPMLTGTHHWTADGRPCVAHIEKVVIASQPVGAMFDWLLNEHGKPLVDRKAVFDGREIGIINVGMNTLDLLGVSNNQPIKPLSGGHQLGVRRLLEIANPGNLYTVAEMDARLRSGSLDLSSALPIWENEVKSVIDQQWGKTWRRFGAVILVGGGVILLRNSLSAKFGALARFSDDDVLSTARGLYKFSLLNKLAEAVACDLGFGAVKLYSAAGSVAMPAAVSLNGQSSIGDLYGLDAMTPRKQRTGAHTAERKPLHIEFGNQSFYVGAGAHAEGRAMQSLDLDRTVGPEVLPLVYGALTLHTQPI